ncbi:hypothetical protein BRADI_4g22018v3 [Brachypodium distachyon]|uniref:Uncharacterized protein n=1 Tax=Brachypodium distachyon TaxID=15368 RepID=A0A2K2CPD1_BRADI|nr:hypothetical protein BRADI_4g22018v3 [Brachypodium distachyon]
MGSSSGASSARRNRFSLPPPTPVLAGNLPQRCPSRSSPPPLPAPPLPRPPVARLLLPAMPPTHPATSLPRRPSPGGLSTRRAAGVLLGTTPDPIPGSAGEKIQVRLHVPAAWRRR